MDAELHHPIDRHSQTLIVRYIELLLDYCTRFYERQFITRENKNKLIIKQTDAILDKYISSGMLRRGNYPTTDYCADLLKLSPCYFEDLLKFETGKTLKEFFSSKTAGNRKKNFIGKEKHSGFGSRPAGICQRTTI